MNRDLGTLVLGGASGTQTLLLDAQITLPSATTVGPNGRLEFGPNGGITGAGGALTVGGTLVVGPSFNPFINGGSLDIAPGGTLRLVTSSESGTSIGNTNPTGAPMQLRLRGRLQAASPGPTVHPVDGIRPFRHRRRDRLGRERDRPRLLFREWHLCATRRSTSSPAP